MEKRTITVPAKDENLEKVLAFTEESLELCGCPMKEQMMIAVCVEEIAVNVFHYAYPDDPEAEKAYLTMDVEADDEAVTFTFTDSGIPYDPLAKEDPDITLSAEDRPIGGLGIYMVKKKMDEVSYHREGDTNVFQMKKSLKPS